MVTILVIVVAAKFVNPIVIESGNQTTTYKVLPAKTWLPFDQQLYYLSALIWTGISLSISAILLALTDILVINLMLYPAQELKCLLHVLRHFDQYKTRQNCFTKAGSAVFSDVIERHKDVIEFGNSLTKITGVFTKKFQVCGRC